MRAWIGLGVLFAATPVWAQAEEEEMPVFADDPDDTTENTGNGYPNQGNYPTVACSGGCPSGMACSPDGVCEQAPSCAGGCPQGMICSPDGVCEVGASTPPPPPAPVCNCPTGFACTPAGTCGPMAQALQPARATYDPNGVAKARRRSTFGFVSAGIVLALGITAGVIEGNDDDNSCGDSCGLPEVPILLGTALYLGVSGLLTYGGSRSARRSGGRGFGILRVGGWITWVAGLAGLLVSGAISSVDGSEPAGFVFGSAILGALGPTFWAIDARIAASQADETQAQTEQARHWSPALQLMRDASQRVVGGTLGATFEL